MRIVICWTGISGYLAGCWRELSKRPDIALKIITFDGFGMANAPFGKSITEGLHIQPLGLDRMSDIELVAAAVADFQPDVVVISGWISHAYSRLPFHPRLKSVKFVMGSDTPRKNNLRQALARFKIGRLLDRMDGVVVAGERAWQLIRSLKVPESKIYRGVYGVDQSLFGGLHARRVAQPDGWPKRFLFAGQYEARKGIDLLATAYQQYRAAVSDPWPLTCCGRGPMEKHFWGVTGLEDRGFVQPADQPDLWANAGVFVLPSRYDPWPLVIVEAAVAGLPILCSEACGSSVELVRSFHNGLTVATDNTAALAQGMAWFHNNWSQLAEMGKRSTELGAAYTTERWADRWISMFRDVLGLNNLKSDSAPGAKTI